MNREFDNKTKRIALDGMLCALAIIFGYIEMMFPINLGIVGLKLGLANVVILLALITLDVYDAVVISVVRVLVIFALFGNVNSFMFSIAGAVCSLVIMYVLIRFCSFHIVVVSLFGAVFHILGQLIVGLLWYPIMVLLYYSILLIVAAVVTGIINGIIVDMVKRCIYNKLV